MRSDLRGAVDAAEEAVARYERLAGAVPAAFTGGLVGALSTLADVLTGLGRDAEAARVRARMAEVTPG